MGVGPNGDAYHGAGPDLRRIRRRRMARRVGMAAALGLAGVGYATAFEPVYGYFFATGS